MGQTVTMVFEAQTAQFISQQLKMREQLVELGKDAEKSGYAVVALGDKAHASSQKMSEGMQQAHSSTAALTASLVNLSPVTLSLDGVFSAFSSGASAQIEIISEKAEKLIDRMKQIGGSLGGAGQAAEIPRVAEWLKTAGKDIYGPAESAQKFADLKRAGGGRFDVPETADAFEAMRDAKGGGVENDVGFGKMYQEMLRFRRKGGGLDHLSKDEFRSEITLLSQFATELEPRELKQISEAPNKEEALAEIIASKKSNEPARAMASYYKLLRFQPSPEQTKKFRHDKKLSADEKALKRLAQIPMEKRPAAMADDPTLIPPEDVAVQAMVGNLDFDIFEDAKKGNLAQARIDQQQQIEKKDATVRRVAENRRKKIKLERMKAIGEQEAIETENNVSGVDATLRSVGWGDGPAGQVVRGIGRWGAYLGYGKNVGQTNADQTSAIRDRGNAMGPYRNFDGTPTGPSIYSRELPVDPPHPPEGMFPAKPQKTLNDVHQSLQQIGSLLHQNNDLTRRAGRWEEQAPPGADV